jgi:geranylgeranyl pyrophosphate synthase
VPVIHAYKNANPSEKEFLATAAKDGEFAANKISDVIALINKYDSIGYSTRMAEKYAMAAIDEIGKFPRNLHGDALAGIADYIVNRTY